MGSKTDNLTRYQRDVLRSADENHMWISAFACINPTDDLKQKIGEWVLDKLASRDSTILCDYDNSEILSKLRQRELILRFNKS